MLEIADKVISGIKLLRETAKRMQNADLQRQIADLMLASADLKLEMAELKAEVLQVREENAALKKKGDLRAMMELREAVCYLKEPLPGYNMGPFCPMCLEIDGILINVYTTDLGWYCPHCKKTPG